MMLFINQWSGQEVILKRIIQNIKRHIWNTAKSRCQIHFQEMICSYYSRFARAARTKKDSIFGDVKRLRCNEAKKSKHPKHTFRKYTKSAY